MAILTKYNPTRGLNRQVADIERPMRDAQLQSNLGRQAAKIALAAQETHDVFAAKREVANFTKAEREFEKQNSSKQYYDFDEIPENVDVRKYDIRTDEDGNKIEVPRTNIPAYEVYPQMYDKHVQGLLDSGAENVPRSVRNKWKFELQESTNAKKQAMFIESEAKQAEQIRIDQKSEFKESLLAQDYNTAMFVAKNFDGSNEEIEAMTSLVLKSNEVDDYNDAMSSWDIPSMEQHLAYLHNDKEQYGGKLNTTERYSMVKQIEARLKTAKDRRSGGRQAKYVVLKKEIKRIQEAVSYGQLLNPQHVLQVQEKAQELNKVLGVEHSFFPVYNDFQEVMSEYGGLNEFAKMQPIQQDTFLKNLPRNTGQDNWRYNLYDKLRSNAQKAVAEDTMTWSWNVGMVDLEPLDFSTGQSAVVSLQERLEKHYMNQAQFGTSSGLLTKDEASSMNAYLDNMQVQDRLAFMQTATAALGEDAIYLWDQIGDDGSNNSSAAGILMTQGKNRQAQRILDGARWRKDNPQMMPVKSEWNVALAEHLGGVYSSSPSEHKRAVEAISNIYASYMGDSGDIEGDLDDDVLDQAVLDYTNGIAEIGDSRVTTPQGWSEDTMDDYVRDLPESFWRNQGGAPQYKGDFEQLNKDIRSGNLILQQTGHNRFLIFSKIGSEFLKQDNGDNLIFTFDDEVMLNSSARSGQGGR